MPLTALLGRKLDLFCCTSITKRPPSTTEPSDDLHRPILIASSWLPLYLKKFTSLRFSNPVADDKCSASTSDYDGDIEPEVDVETSTPNFSSVYSSPRFFISSPGFSNSILDSPSSVEDKKGKKAVEVEVQTTDSPDPYSDFRRSMEEIVEARELYDVQANWENLQELLSRYLSLNAEPNHKFIAGAFADLLVSLMIDGGDGV